MDVSNFKYLKPKIPNFKYLISKLAKFRRYIKKNLLYLQKFTEFKSPTHLPLTTNFIPFFPDCSAHFRASQLATGQLRTVPERASQCNYSTFRSVPRRLHRIMVLLAQRGQRRNGARQMHTQGPSQ